MRTTNYHLLLVTVSWFAIQSAMAQTISTSIAIGKTTFDKNDVGFNELPETDALAFQFSLGTEYIGASALISTAYNSLNRPQYSHNKYTVLLWGDFEPPRNLLYTRQDIKLRIYAGLGTTFTKTPDRDEIEFGRATPTKTSQHTDFELGLGVSINAFELNYLPTSNTITVGVKFNNYWR